ncbi:MAG: transketolase-like TK C-terminal-containing protein, partial [Aquiluna sp.]
VPISDAQLEADPYMPPYFMPDSSSPELQYMHERRKQLGGYLPERRSKYVDFKLPEDSAYDVPRKGSGNQEVATTMAFVRMLKDLLRSEGTGERIQLIIPDEARTFGMDAFFPTSKIYNPNGMKYISVDRELLLNYKESEAGQILHTGINEAGSVAAFTASGSSYSTHGQPIIPIYVFYSMFGFQRTADSLWLAGDQMVRGFLIGATAGRTTLTGEGLQHADGHSPIIAYTNPAVISYDAAYGYEIAHIVKAGFERMYGGKHEDPNVMYYLTVYNEPMLQPAEPENLDVDGVLRGIYKLSSSNAAGHKVQLLASGVAVPWAIESQQLLAEYGVAADIWSVTSWGELRKDGLRADEQRFLYPDQDAPMPYLTQKLADAEGPFLGVSDYTHSLPDMIRPWVPGDFATLGADGFGFSDTRPAARRFFKIDGPSIAVRALEQLVAQGKLDAGIPQQAIDKFKLHDVSAGTSGSAGGDA